MGLSMFCKGCEQELDVACFGKDRNTPTGFTYKCKECRNRKTREYSRAHGHYKQRNSRHADYRRNYYARPDVSRRVKNQQLQKTFGITIEQFDQLLAAQNGVCAICRQPERAKYNKNLAVDHCHDHGTIRGLLCSHCNRALGLFDDDFGRLLAAAYYILKGAAFKNEQKSVTTH